MLLLHVFMLFDNLFDVGLSASLCFVSCREGLNYVWYGDSLPCIDLKEMSCNSN